MNGNKNKFSLISLIIQLSGGLITDKNTAKYALLFLAATFLVLTIIILQSTFSGGVPVGPVSDI